MPLLGARGLQVACLVVIAQTFPTPASSSTAPARLLEEDNVPPEAFEEDCRAADGSACDVSLLQMKAQATQLVQNTASEEASANATEGSFPCWNSCGGRGGICEWCGEERSCCKYGDNNDPASCRDVHWWPVYTFHVCVKPSKEAFQKEVAQRATNGPAEAPLLHFYVYRSMSTTEWPFGNVNVGNLAGAMWYLTNEVIPKCPKRYNISQIKRYKINYKATPHLYDKGMNFGVRYSYDAGKCTGSNTVYLGPCSWTWDRFGYVVGCNNFADHYPWPVVKTSYPEGIWYDLPIEGKCGQPDGTWNCTWSYEDAGHVLIEEELEADTPGKGYSCHGRSTTFWNHRSSKSSSDWRMQKVLDKFAEKYPDHPRELPAPTCDFRRGVYWSSQVPMDRVKVAR